jgi:RNA polymerase sporulation-specific sigma factor
MTALAELATAGHRPPRPPAAGSDEQLVQAARAGDQRALHDLLDRYRGLARSRARSYFLVGGDREDVVQEGMIGLYKAVRDHADGHGASFRSFAELCITRQIVTAVKTATRQKHAPLDAYVSFDGPHGDDPQGAVGDRLAVEVAVDPLQRLVEEDDLRELQRTFHEVLSAFETEVVQLYVEGRGYREIAALLGRHVKTIDNALQRSRRKLERALVR